MHKPKVEMSFGSSSGSSIWLSYFSRARTLSPYIRPPTVLKNIGELNAEYK